MVMIRLHNSGHTVTPVLTSFVPSLPHGAPFSISIHSWTPQPFFPGGLGTPSMKFWELRAIVDGLVVRTLHLPVNGHWPQVIGALSHIASRFVVLH